MALHCKKDSDFPVPSQDVVNAGDGISLTFFHIVRIGCAAHFFFVRKQAKCDQKPFRLEPKKFKRNRRTLPAHSYIVQYQITFHIICCCQEAIINFINEKKFVIVLYCAELGLLHEQALLLYYCMHFKE